MTQSPADPELELIADLPATLAGLWTAITMTHGIAERHVDPGDPRGFSDVPAGVAAACAEAAESITASRREVFVPCAELPDPRALEPVEELALLGAMSSGCIGLAVDLLGNEDEPLTPVEVLAVTRAVTALCIARSLTEARVA